MKPLTNNLKKFVTSLKMKKNRDDNGFFVAEGIKLCSELIDSTYKTEFVVVRSGPDSDIDSLAGKFEILQVPVYIARKQQFDGMASTRTPQGIMAVVNTGEPREMINGPFIALDAVSDPGNLGTIIRTADWFGFRNIILGPGCADKYNPKSVRATMGSLFRCSVTTVDSLTDFFSRNAENYQIFGADLNGKIKLDDCQPDGINFGIVLGSEAKGISEPVIKTLTHKFIIPGIGEAESLNVAVSTGISLYHFSKYLL